MPSHLPLSGDWLMVVPVRGEDGDRYRDHHHFSVSSRDHYSQHNVTESFDSFRPTDVTSCQQLPPHYHMSYEGREMVPSAGINQNVHSYFSSRKGNHPSVYPRVRSSSSTDLTSIDHVETRWGSHSPFFDSTSSLPPVLLPYQANYPPVLAPTASSTSRGYGRVVTHAVAADKVLYPIGYPLHILQQHSLSSFQTPPQSCRFPWCRRFAKVSGFCLVHSRQRCAGIPNPVSADNIKQVLDVLQSTPTSPGAHIVDGKRKRSRKRCSLEGCDRFVQRKGFCYRHGPRVKRCSVDQCHKAAVKGSICVRHGAPVRRCVLDGCPNISVKNGVCTRHGAPVKRCKVEGCANVSVKMGVCVRHGAKVSFKKRFCSVTGCTRISKNKGLCVRHGTSEGVNICSYGGCQTYAKKRGLCSKHLSSSSSSSNRNEHMPHQVNQLLITGSEDTAIPRCSQSLSTWSSSFDEDSSSRSDDSSS